MTNPSGKRISLCKHFTRLHNEVLSKDPKEFFSDPKNTLELYQHPVAKLLRTLVKGQTRTYQRCWRESQFWAEKFEKAIYVLSYMILKEHRSPFEEVKLLDFTKECRDRLYKLLARYQPGFQKNIDRALRTGESRWNTLYVLKQGMTIEEIEKTIRQRGGDVFENSMGLLESAGIPIVIRHGLAQLPVLPEHQILGDSHDISPTTLEEFFDRVMACWRESEKQDGQNFSMDMFCPEIKELLQDESSLFSE